MEDIAELSLRARCRPAPDVVAQRLGDSTVLVHLGTSRFYELNETASLLWEALEEHSSVQAAMEVLAGEYAVEPEALLAEVAQLMNTLRQAGLVEYAGE